MRQESGKGKHYVIITVVLQWSHRVGDGEV